MPAKFRRDLDGRCFTFSTAAYENLGAGWRSKYGTDQFLTCRDAFNGRMLWRKRIGDTYYGGLYIEFMHIGYGEFTGDTVSWNDNYVATSNQDSGGSIVALTESAKARGFPAAPPFYQATSLVLCNNVLLQGGAILDQEREHGFIRAIGLEDGQVVWEKKFDAKLAFNGLAVDTCGIIASFDDGTVACLK